MRTGSLPSTPVRPEYSVQISEAPSVSMSSVLLPVTPETDSIPSDTLTADPNTISSLFRYVHGRRDCLLKYFDLQHPRFSGVYDGIRSCIMICERDLHPPAPLIIVSVMPSDSEATTAPRNPSGCSLIIPPPSRPSENADNPPGSAPILSPLSARTCGTPGTPT